MVHTIAQKEFLASLRDRRFMALSLIVFVLLFTASLVGLYSVLNLQEEQQTAQQTVNEQWVNQPDRHPHRVAHYGSFAFRPKASLSFLDFGIDSYTGVSVFMEAHRQNSANFSQAQQSGSLIRFGEMTVAFVLQMLIPLLIIFLCFGAFTQEKESGTLKVLLSQGVSMRQIALAKIRGYSKVLVLVIGPSLLLAGIFLFSISDFHAGEGMLLRLLLFIAFYLIYFFIFIVVSVVVSALSRHSRQSLVGLLGIWILGCIIIPKATANIGASLYPAPDRAHMDAAIHEEVLKGIDGHNAKDERAEGLKQELLAKYGVDSLEQLPVNFDGIIMAEGEAYSSMVYQQHFRELQQTFEKQNSISVWAGFLNPYLSLRQLSMAMAGADFQHYMHFQQEAERYRFGFVQRLNEIQATELSYGDKTRRLSSDTWSSFEPFSYELPGVSWTLSQHLPALAALLFWLLLLPVLGLKLIEKASIL